MSLFRRLQFRLFLALIVVASVPIGIVSVVNYNTAIQLVTEEVEARQIEVTKILAEQVTLFVEDIISTLEIIGRGGFGLGFDATQLNDYISTYLLSEENGTVIYQAIWLMDALGNEVGGIFNNEAIQLTELLNRSEDEIFFRPQRGETYFSNVRVMNQSPEISLSVPIYDTDDTFIGVVGAIIDLQATWDIIRELELGQTGYAMLLDRRGNVMVHRDNIVVNSRYNLANLQPFISAFRSTTINVYQYNSPIGGNVVGSAHPIIGPNWVLMVERPTNEAFVALSKAGQTIIVGFLSAVIFSLVINIWLSRQIAQPIVSLRNVVQRFGTGSLTVRSDIHTQDEIGQLSEGFNAMADRLKTRIEEINLKNDALQQANEKVLEASRLKDEFLAIMSHELRTPLNAIIGFTGIMLIDSHLLNDNQISYLQRVEANSERLLSLITDILDISRIQAGYLSLNATPITVYSIVERIHTQLDVLAKEKNLVFTTEIDDNLPQQIMLDEDSFIKIITNLCSNGIKFTHHGSVKLHLSQEGEMVVIRVSDTGIGIAPHMQDIIFEEFRQVDSSSQRSYGGTGLGLAIVRRLTMALGGKVMVMSEVDKGSVFTVTLPLIAKNPTEKMEG